MSSSSASERSFHRVRLFGNVSSAMKRVYMLAFALVVLVVLVLLAGAIWTQVLAARAERDFPPEGRFFEVEGQRLHVVDRGSGAAIVLLHGAFGGSQDWTATGILDELARTHRVLAFDRPGHGWSERASTAAQSPMEQARVLRAACHAMGVERPLLVGFSWGGSLVLAWALAWPDEIAGVLTVNGVAYPWPGATNTSYVLAGLPIVGPLLAFTAAAPLGALTADASVERAFAPASVPSSFAYSPIALALRPRQFLAETADLRILKPAVAIQATRYAEISVPISILAGRGDRVAHWDWHSQRLQRAVSQAEITLPQAEITLPQAEITAPQAKISAPQAEITAPQAEITAPQAKISAPQAEMTAPQAKITVPQAKPFAPQVEFTVLEDAGHQVLHSHPRAVIEAVQRLAQRVATR